jgi:hypothetical protein
LRVVFSPDDLPRWNFRFEIAEVQVGI